ncbi:hypothetical protein BGZ65_000178, partial [Modicella reniformis]
YLDEQRRVFGERQQAEVADLESDYRTIEFNINGVDVPFGVKLSSLRKALNLPLFDLNGMQTFQGDDLRRPVEDMEDVDHAVNDG